MVNSVEGFSLFFEELPKKPRVKRPWRKSGKAKNKKILANNIRARRKHRIPRAIPPLIAPSNFNRKDNPTMGKLKAKAMPKSKVRGDNNDNLSYNGRVIKKRKDITMTDKNKKIAKAPKTNSATGVKSMLNGILGVALLIGVLSIGYSTTVIVMGTDGWIPIAMVVPQTVLAVGIAAWKFSK